MCPGTSATLAYDKPDTSAMYSASRKTSGVVIEGHEGMNDIRGKSGREQDRKAVS